MRVKFAFFFSIILFLTTTSGYARKFYFSSSSGNDSYTQTQAQNPNTPWKTLIQLEYAYRTIKIFIPGDTICFKRGDVFANGRDQFGSMKWWNDGTTYFNAPSGTASKPIVFTNYGDTSLTLPNFLFPNPGTAISANNARHCLSFQGVGYLIFDGLQFNDFRFPYTDKVSAAYTTTGLHLGERPDGVNVGRDAHHITVKNCFFSNIGYGIMSSGSYITINNNRFTNFKSVGDTSGSTIFSDIGSIPIQPQGDHYVIENNYIRGGWSYSSPTATGQGMLGGAIEVINEFDHSRVMYNIIVDCEGMYEFGRNIAGDTLLGPNDDTTAYNLIINSGKIAYIHTGSSQFAVRASKLRFYNNVYIENNFSRFSGPNFGKDIYNDGQSFNQFPGWSQGYPRNPSEYNVGGHRIIQYPSETVKGNPDTLVDFRNNLIWNTTGLQQVYDNSRTKYKRANNVYHLVGRWNSATALGGTLNTGNFQELLSTAKLLSDTSQLNPELWNFSPYENSPLINFGRFTGLLKDFDNTNVVGNPDVGIQEFTSSASALPMSATASSTSIVCPSGNSIVTISANGGLPPYSYSMNNGAFQSSSVFTTVPAGSHTFIVRDANFSTASITQSITQPAPINAVITNGQISAFGGLTSLSITSTTGGTPPYTYQLNGGAYQSSTSFNSLQAGVYQVNVKDSRGCVQSFNHTITQPPSTLNATVTISGPAITCNGGTTSVQVNASGGLAPYSGIGTFQVQGGSRNFIVTDAAGAIVERTIIVNQPNPILLTLSSGRIIITGNRTTITAVASGGTGLLTYKLNNGTYQSSNVFTNVPAGLHRVSVKDANNCIKVDSLFITQPAALLTASATILQNIICYGTTGHIRVTATGGTPPYTGTGDFYPNSGSYVYTVRDSNGVTFNTTAVSLTQPTSAINFNVSSGYISPTESTTTISVTGVSNGTAPYQYALDNGTYQNTFTFSGVTPGIRNVTVRDSRGCSFTKSVTVNAPLRALTTSVIHNSCASWNGSITASASGGTPPYSYKLNKSGTNTWGFGSNFLFTKLGPFTYKLVVRDSRGDSAFLNVTINPSYTPCNKGEVKSETLNTHHELENQEVTIFPNPTHSFYLIKPISMACEVSVYTMNGNLLRTFNYKADQTLMFGSDWPAGSYLARIRSSNGSVFYRKLVKL